MNFTVAVSVIVVSRERPGPLTLCLTALGQQSHHPFEVIVVADAAGCAAARAHELGDRLKIVLFDQPNVAAARNAGLSRAAAPVAAFIDDDAFAEPHWLHHLAGVFADEHIDAAGGFVIGRNGISLQWGARSVDVQGLHTELALDGSATVTPRAAAGQAVRTEGTNCAFRIGTLAALGGFDSEYRFYMDDTDLNMRLARANRTTAIVPMARVHHAHAPSAYRTAQRMPRTLTEIGASLAVYLARHAPPGSHADAIAAHRADQRRRLLRHMVAGTCTPGDVTSLMYGFERGLAEGASRPPANPWTPQTPPDFRPLRDAPPKTGIHRAADWAWRMGPHIRAADTEVEGGGTAHLLRLTPTTLYHRLRYVAPGLWLQAGGLFGRSDRSGPLFRPFTIVERLQAERLRLAPRHHISASKVTER